MKIADLPQVVSLSIEEKISLVEELWDQIARAGEAVPLPEWHKQALEHSLAEYRKNPREGSTWAEARARILSRK
jgi:putative addiction module component (TIGR02574 family)